MDFNSYQADVKKTAIYPHQGENLAYPALGLTGEAGEVADKIKKLIRDRNGTPTDSERIELVKELGDVLWYLAILAWELGVDFEDVAVTNIKKLKDRKERGVLQGEGDNR